LLGPLSFFEVLSAPWHLSLLTSCSVFSLVTCLSPPDCEVPGGWDWLTGVCIPRASVGQREACYVLSELDCRMVWGGVQSCSVWLFSFVPAKNTLEEQCYPALNLTSSDFCWSLWIPPGKCSVCGLVLGLASGDIQNIKQLGGRGTDPSDHLTRPCDGAGGTAGMQTGAMSPWWMLMIHLLLEVGEHSVFSH
jgi:hypothetical protein